MALPRFKAYPSTGTITIADGDIYPINRGGDFVSIKHANQTFVLRLDDEHELSASVNRKFRMTDGDTFKKVEIVNNSGYDLTFQVEIGYGDVDTNDIAINSAVKVRNDNSPHHTLAVDDVFTQSAIADLQVEIQGIKSSIQGDNTARAPLNSLKNCEYARVVNATTTLVTAAENVNGIRVPLANVHDLGTGSARAYIGGNIFVGATPSGSSTTQGSLQNPIELPAGQSLVISSAGAGGEVYIYFEVL